MSKALQINTSLKTLAIDRNSITVHGYSDIAYALERYEINVHHIYIFFKFNFGFFNLSNRTLRYLPYPLHDIMVAAKAGPEKVDSLWKQIQESLQRNVVPSQTGTTPTVRLQQGAMLSSTQQLLDRLVNQTSEAIRNVQRQGNDSKAAEVEVARGLLDDAHGAKQVGISILENYQKLFAYTHLFSVTRKIDELCGGSSREFGLERDPAAYAK